MAIYIIRHGQTVWNLENRKQGHSDSPLTLKGIEQAGNVCDILKKENLDYQKCHIFVSPLFRTKQYAQIILENLKINKKLVSEEYLIKEHGFGAWEGLTQDEVDKLFPKETEKRMQDRWNYIIHGGGESYEIISRRAEQFLKKINFNNDKNIILICHEMVSKMLRYNLLGLSKNEALDLNHPQDVVYRYCNKGLANLKN